MNVVVRDDDTSYFSSPEAIERVYGAVWDAVPVSLAVVPFAVGYPRTGIPEGHWYSGEVFPLEQNPALVEYLREHVRKRHCNILLHGYTHQAYPDGYEFEVAPDLERRLRVGRAYLETLLDVRVSVFVPPHNALSRRGLRALDAVGLDVLGSFLSFHPAYRPWDLRTPGNWWRIWRFRRATGRSRQDPMVYPFVLRYRRHREFGCHLLIPGTTLDALVRGFEEARRFGGDFCLATHHWELDETLRETFFRFLDYASRFPDVSFVPAEVLFR